MSDWNSDSQVMFETVVNHIGVPRIIAEGLVRRTLNDVNVAPEIATASDYLRAMDNFETRLSLYFPGAAGERKLLKIKGYLNSLK